MKIYLLRHTRVNIPQGICYGQTDVGVADTFAEEAAAAKKRLQGISFAKIYSSPLSRCARLANEFADAREIVFDERLLELNFGDWEGKSWNHIYENEAGGKAWFSDYENTPCPNGESYSDMLARVHRFIADLPQTNGNVLIVTHAGVVRAFRVLLHGWSVKKAFDKAVAYGQVTVVAKN